MISIEVKKPSGAEIPTDFIHPKYRKKTQLKERDAQTNQRGYYWKYEFLYRGRDSTNKKIKRIETY